MGCYTLSTLRRNLMAMSKLAISDRSNEDHA